MPPTGDRTLKWVENTVNSAALVIFSQTTCGFCIRVKKLFDDKKIRYAAIELNGRPDKAEILQSLQQYSGIKSTPQVFSRGQFIGDCSEIQRLDKEGKLEDKLKKSEYDYDLIVLGGGSGGLAAAKEAAKYGAKVALLDYVKPTPQGTKWGLGGTCVNVGCIPKKLMHNAAILGHAVREARDFGWSTGEKGFTHNWTDMVRSVQQHIKSLNWGYKTALGKVDVDYINAMGELVGPHAIRYTDRKGDVKSTSASKIILAMGERPRYPGIPGDELYAITSDDIFSRSCFPGKTLVVGASYVALECAGFLASVGTNVTVMVRSILLRGFDQQMANMIGKYMDKEQAGEDEDKDSRVNFVRECVPTEITEVVPADYKNNKLGSYRVKGRYNDGTTFDDEFNTIILAIGRSPIYNDEALTKLGIKLDKSRHLICSEDDMTSMPDVYAIGDIVSGKPQLTPMAIQAGRLLARRLFAGSTQLTEYTNVPTTVFTPLEYGACGLSEEAAIEKYGVANIEVYHSNFIPLEWALSDVEDKNKCYAKLICLKNDNERVVGFHVLGPNAGEMTQGFGVAMKAGANKQDFDRTIGIHPTCAEIFTTLHVTKSSGQSPQVTSC